MTSRPLQIAIPTLVRIKPGACARLGIYLKRYRFTRVMLVMSEGLPASIRTSVLDSIQSSEISITESHELETNDLDTLIGLFKKMSRATDVVVGVGGGRALDAAKYLASLAKLPFIAFPTSLSNDGFCSPQSSLLIDGKRRSLAARLPFGVVVDTELCAQAPRSLTLSGVGDLAAKFTAIFDWKLAFHATGEEVDDFAALLSDGSVRAFLAHPEIDAMGIRMLATSLMFNGIAMEICGSSRPASGSEHLISHALDEATQTPRLHGIQVGVATYLMSLLQGANTSEINGLFASTGFWDHVHADPFYRDEWLAAIARAPAVKPDRYTILSSRDVLKEAESLMKHDPLLARCFC